MTDSEPYEVLFDDVADNVRETVQPTPEDSGTYVGLEHLDSDSLRVTRWGAEVDLEGIKLRMGEGDVLFARRNAYLRRVALAPFDGLFSAHGLVLRPKANGIIPGFLPYFMKSDVFAERAVEISVGSLSPTINWPVLAKQRFVLPSRDTQLRVTALMQAADAVIECSERVQTQLRVMADVLGEELLPVDAASSTRIATLVEDGILDAPQDGNHGDLHPKGRDFIDVGVPFLTAGDIRNGKVHLSGAKRVSREQADGLRIGFAHPGDVLLTHKGTVGEVAVLPQLEEPYAMLSPQVTYYRVRQMALLSPAFLYHALQAPPFQRQLRLMSQQSTRAYVGITKQRTLFIPFPPVNEQVEITRRFAALERAHATEGEFQAKTAALKRATWQELCATDVH